MAAVREEWLQLTHEAPIDASLPICDPHHHLWDRPGHRYFLEEFLRDAQSGHNVVSTVFVECSAMYRKGGAEEMRPVGETEFAQGMAAQSASGQYGETAVAAGIVGFADLTLGSAVARVIESHLAASPNRFRGIRHQCTWDASPAVMTRMPSPPPGLMLDHRFRAGFACLQKYGLSYEAWQYYPQLPELAALARAFPETAIILNHTGGLLALGPYAGKRDEVFRAWSRNMADVAACPNVFVKLGGLGMLRCGFEWHTRPAPPTSAELAEATAPYFRFCIERFGANRCMFESNFPVDKISSGYCVLWNSFKRVIHDYSPTERAAVLHDTAARVYLLTPTDAG